MVSLEQVRLLESKVTNVIAHVKNVTDENSKLKEKLGSYQKRIEDLEVLVQQFRENQSRIEDGILSALDRLNQFEDALESKLSIESKPSVELPSIESKPESKPPVKSEPPRETKTPDKAVDEGKTSDTAKKELDIF